MTLAGRIAYHELDGFRLGDVGADQWRRLWMRGGLPRSYTAQTEAMSHDWLHNYITTFLERDVPQLGIDIPSKTLRRFWAMLCHYHGQLMNYSEFARSFGVADTTVRGYLDRLTAALVVRQLQP